MRRACRGAGIRSSRALALGALIGVLLAAGACATPIGVSLTDPQEIHGLGRALAEPSREHVANR
jgi:hypothetical protein